MATVLVVEDDSTLRGTLYELLAEEHVCHTAETVEQALVFLGVETYDVVLADYSMSGLNGLDLLGHIQQSQPGTPVIFLSGFSHQERAQELIKMGAFDYLAKPFRLEDVEARIARALESKRAQK